MGFAKPMTFICSYFSRCLVQSGCIIGREPCGVHWHTAWAGRGEGRREAAVVKSLRRQTHRPAKFTGPAGVNEYHEKSSVGVLFLSVFEPFFLFYSHFTPNLLSVYSYFTLENVESKTRVKSRLERYFVISIWDNLWWCFSWFLHDFFVYDLNFDSKFRKFRTRKRQLFELIPTLRCRMSGLCLKSKWSSKLPVLIGFVCPKVDNFGVVSTFFKFKIGFRNKIAFFLKQDGCAALQSWGFWTVSNNYLLQCLGLLSFWKTRYEKFNS